MVTKHTQIRGGVGIFTSRVPLVWPGGTYNNNGITAGFIQLTGSNTPALIQILLHSFRILRQEVVPLVGK